MNIDSDSEIDFEWTKYPGDYEVAMLEKYTNSHFIRGWNDCAIMWLKHQETAFQIQINQI